MKKIARISILSLTALLLIVTAFSCNNSGKYQSTEFAAFIKAYTGGIISDKASIFIELASDVPDAIPGADIKSGVVSFSPSVKGSARWITNRVIEYTPESGALKPGQSYTGTLRLDKLQKVSNRKFKRFNFNFLVAIKEAVLSLDNLTITSAAPEKASVRGTIAITEALPVEKVQEMFEYSYFDKSAEVSVTAGTDPLHFHFDIIDLARTDKDNELEVSLKPKDTGFITDSKLSITIPAMGDFRVLSAERVDASDPYIDVYFSEALEDVDDNQGLIQLTGLTDFSTQTENCHVKVFFDQSELTSKSSNDAISLVISSAITSYDGTKLGVDFTKEFASTDEKPALEIPVNGNILPDSKELILPFKAVNLQAVDVSVIQIYEDNVLMFLQDNDLDGDASLRRAGRLVYKTTIRLDANPSKNLHKWQDFSVDLSGLFKKEAGAIYRIRLSFKQAYSLYGKNEDFKSGVPSNKMVDVSYDGVTEEDDDKWDEARPYFYEEFYDWTKYSWEDKDNPNKPSYYMEEMRFPAINLLTSRLGVIAKYSGTEKLWVSVSDILTTDPVFNAELYAYNYQLKEIGYAKTGTDGMAEMTLSGKPFVVTAKRGGSISYLKVTNGDEKNTSRFDVGGKVLEKGLKAYIYGERGVWRPGDVMHVTMILDDRDKRIPDSHPAIAEIYTPQGQFYTKLINNNGKNGFYVFDIKTKAEDPTGIWNAYFKIGSASFHKSLRVESIKPNRLKVNLSLSEDILEGNKRIPISISSNWLAGPAASNLKAKVDITLRKGPSTFKGFDGYVFTNPLSEFTTFEKNIIDTRLNNNGTATISSVLPAAEDAPGMLLADMVTSVEEEGGDVSYNTTTVPYSPFSSYVGIKSPKEKGLYLETDKDYSINVVTVNREGKKVSGVHLSYSVFKLNWSWWWESDNNNLDSYVNGSSANALFSGTLTSSGEVSIPFCINYPEWGRYLVIVKDEDSGHVTGDILYADWPSYRGRSSKTDPDALTMLSFSTDKKTYDVGETVNVFIPKSGKGHALVSIENSRTVISREWVKTNEEEDTKYSFKVTPEMSPNFYINVSLIQPHKRVSNDLPIRLYGIEPIMVNNPESHLNPVISMPDVLHPEEEFSIKISEKNNKSMTYTIAVVDEGLLDLTSFKTPDPWKSMYEREALGVKTWDLYDKVIGAFSGRFSPMFSIGGDENLLLGSKKDNRFNPVVEFLGPFTLQNGSATHKITLPMYVGSVRVMVVAGKNGAYGNADKTVAVKSPLMVVTTLPRVIGNGEDVVLPVNVFAMKDDVKNVNVNVKVEGPLKIVGDASKQISFSSQGDQLVRFALTATGVGEAKVMITSTSGSHKASETISINAINPNPPTLSITRGVIAKGETKEFNFNSFAEGPDEWASLELAGYPSVNADGIYSFLRHYSYNCSEQLASIGSTYLAIKDLLSDEKQEAINDIIPDLIQKLSQRQLASGGFAYWPGDSDANSWVSSMAGQFLVTASQKGYSVSNGILTSWSRYQKKVVQEYRNTDNGYLWDLEQAYRLYTLALNSDAEGAAMNRLKESENLSSQAAWMLASAYAVAGKKNIAQEIVKDLKSDFSPYSSKDRTFGSPIRDKAIAMNTLLLLDEIPGAMDVSQEIAESLSSGWYVTQETAFATTALALLAEKYDKNGISADVTIGDKAKAVKSSKSLETISINPEEGGVKVANNSDGSLYATLITSTVAKDGVRVPASANGIRLSVRYTTANGDILNPEEIAQGTDFIATITVSNASGIKDYSELALTERIPSGWEIYNDRLFNQSTNDGMFDNRDIRDDRVIWHFDLAKGMSKSFRIKLHAAYEGEFVLPAVTCEAMYDLHVNASSASGTAKVVR